MNAKTFESKLDGFKQGKRIQISRDLKKIEASGNSTRPEPIPQTPYYAVTTLSNQKKRTILGDILFI
jgi:negative regulator of replication initiation